MNNLQKRVWVLVVALVALATGSGALAATTGKQKSYAAPEEAFKALVDALKSDVPDAALGVLGQGAKSVLSSGDKIADRAARARFLKAYEEANKIENPGADMAILSVGKDAWPFPIPVVKDKEGWRFDVAVGKEEIINRRVGRNELDTMQAAIAYTDAQREYYLSNPQRAKLHQYAQKIASSPGKRDGLYYPTKAGEPPSPLGPLFERALKEGYKAGGGAYHGYRYKILKAQGADAKGGAYGYVAKGAMIGGHALIAWPAAYGNSGVMSFMVSHDGVLYEKDLGPQTDALAGKVTQFNPDKSWKAVAK